MESTVPGTRPRPALVKCSAFEGEIKGRGFESGVRYIVKPVQPEDMGDRTYLTLQLHLSSEVSAASVGLVSSPPERPCENTVDRDAPLSELDSDATDFLDRPADQERCLVRRRRVFLSAGSALAR